jgi:hypothetical protein
MASIDLLLKAIGFLIYMLGWLIVSVKGANKLGFTRSEMLLCAIWSSLVGLGLWFILTLK